MSFLVRVRYIFATSDHFIIFFKFLFEKKFLFISKQLLWVREIPRFPRFDSMKATQVKIQWTFCTHLQFLKTHLSQNISAVLNLANILGKIHLIFPEELISAAQFTTEIFFIRKILPLRNIFKTMQSKYLEECGY